MTTRQITDLYGIADVDLQRCDVMLNRLHFVPRFSFQSFSFQLFGV